MKESRIKLQTIVYWVSPIEVGQEFSKPWPLHLTLVPPFHDARQRELDKELGEFAESAQSVELKIGERAIFGPDSKGNAVPAELVEPADKMHQLHIDLVDCVIRTGGILDDVSHTGHKYNPHISNREGVNLEDAYRLNSFALVNRDGNDYTVKEMYELR